MRFHYLISAHGSYEHVLRLVAALREDSSESHIVVQHDCKSSPPDRGLFEPLRATSIPTRRPVNWGDLSLTFEFMAWLRTLALTHADWVVHLSGTDYPLPAFRHFESRLAASGADMVLEQSILSNPDAPDLLDRYHQRSVVLPRMFGGDRRGADLARKAVSQVVRRLSRVTLRDQPRGLPPRVEFASRMPFEPRLRLNMGNEWCALSGRAVSVLLEEDARHPEVARWFKRTALGAEAYVHTVLLSQAGLVNLPQSLHYLEFHGPNPKWLDASDLHAMLNSEFPFARKFKPGAPVLDAIDEARATLAPIKDRRT